MHNRTRFRYAVAATAVALVSAACGLKPAATDSLKTTGGGAGAGSGAGALAAGQPSAGPLSAGAGGGAATAIGAGGGSAPLGSSSGTSGTGGTATTTTTGNGTGSHTGTRSTPGGLCGVPSGGTTTGVTASTINLGLHAPLSGTGTPFPNSSFEKGAGTFWKQSGHTVCGRKVNVEFQDDTYTPAGARSVCSAMAKRDFLVAGGGGTDQIQACATDPDIQRLGVPYLSAGVTDNGMTNLSNYFAVSLTYAQQGALVLRNAIQQGIAHPAASNQKSDNVKGKNAVWAVVTAGTPNFAGARNGMEAALNAAHIPYKDFQIDQSASNYDAAATQFGDQLALDGFKTIFFDAAPGYFVFTTKGFYNTNAAGGANWVGPGVTYTEVTVAQYICASPQISGHAWFLAPAPGLDHATSDFKKAYNGSYDDIEWSLWGLSETLWGLLKNASANLTRQNFIGSTERSIVPSSVYAPVDYLHHGGHFGGTGAWVQKVSCTGTETDQNQPGTWVTVGSHYLSLY
jgi:branched-chain amino acid transport system substrate-binding protein